MADKSKISLPVNNKKQLSKLKRSELFEIMLEQGREIDALRAEVEDLKNKLESRRIRMDSTGTLAEASFALTEIFREADKVAEIYLENIRGMAADRGIAVSDAGTAASDRGMPVTGAEMTSSERGAAASGREVTAPVIRLAVSDE